MTPDERAALLRLAAARHRLAAARLDFAAAAAKASGQISGFVATWRRAEHEEFETHPDVQETVAGLRGFYGDDPFARGSYPS